MVGFCLSIYSRSVKFQFQKYTHIGLPVFKHLGPSTTFNQYSKMYIKGIYYLHKTKMSSRFCFYVEGDNVFMKCAL